MKTKLLLLVAGATFLWSCGQESANNTDNTTPDTTQIVKEVDAVWEKASKIFAVLPDNADTHAENKVTDAKVKLGKHLYHDTRLSKNQTQSCNTCHDVSTYGVDRLPVSPGDNGGNGTRNSPTVYNAALHAFQFWDGREPDVEAQAGGPVMNPVEMNMPSEDVVVDRLKKVEAYKSLFAEAFPESTDAVSFKNMTYAIAAFERTLLTPSKFDKYLAGEAVFSSEEKKGLETFMNVGCIACHNGALLGATTFQKFAYNENDKGRFDVTKEEKDMYLFKTASLRNVAETFPYFHDGGVAKLDEAVKLMGKHSLNKELSDEETAQIVTFLKTLTGEIPAGATDIPTQL